MASALALLPLPGRGQSSTHFEVPAAALSAGGAEASSTHYEAGATLGQAAAGGERVGTTLLAREGLRHAAGTQSGSAVANNALVTISRSRDSAVAGDIASYTITVDSDMAGVSLTLHVQFPPELESVSWTCTPGLLASCTPAGSADILDTVVASLAPATALYTVNGVIGASALGSLTVTATVARQDGLADSDPSDDTATDSLEILPVSP